MNLFVKAHKMVATEIKLVKRGKKPADEVDVAIQQNRPAFAGFADQQHSLKRNGKS